MNINIQQKNQTKENNIINQRKKRFLTYNKLKDLQKNQIIPSKPQWDEKFHLNKSPLFSNFENQNNI